MKPSLTVIHSQYSISSVYNSSFVLFCFCSGNSLTVAQAGLKLAVLPPQPLESWDWCVCHQGHGGSSLAVTKWFIPQPDHSTTKGELGSFWSQPLQMLMYSFVQKHIRLLE